MNPGEADGGEAGCRRVRFAVEDYDLGATLDSGQAFRWEAGDGGWTGVVGGRWVRLRQEGGWIDALTVDEPGAAGWLSDYLQLEFDLASALRSFPAGDAALSEAVSSCRGLRVLRQDPWECLASFILSSTKQIVQIRRIISSLAVRFGERLRVPEGEGAAHSFPTADRLASCRESEIRECGAGFRAPYLLEAAGAVSTGALDLGALRLAGEEEARARLMELRGVGRKIADCVLLFALDKPQAFPVDVWVQRVLRSRYFRGGGPAAPRLIEFARDHFGPHGGLAQQYLFHHARVAGRVAKRASGSAGERRGRVRSGVRLEHANP